MEARETKSEIRLKSCLGSGRRAELSRLRSSRRAPRPVPSRLAARRCSPLAAPARRARVTTRAQAPAICVGAGAYYTNHIVYHFSASYRSESTRLAALPCGHRPFHIAVRAKPKDGGWAAGPRPETPLELVSEGTESRDLPRAAPPTQGAATSSTTTPTTTCRTSRSRWAHWKLRWRG